jgi:exonuclease III
VRGACCDIFEEEELDNEGRCLVLELNGGSDCEGDPNPNGNIVIFNVYVPTSGQKYARIPFKMRFLTRLRDKMKQVRAAGKRVILCGDLNIAPEDSDVNWRDRVVMLEEIESLYNNYNHISSSSSSLQQQTEVVTWPKDPLALEVLGKVARAVPQIRQAIEDIQVVKIPGKSDQQQPNSSSNNRYARKDDSYKAVVNRRKEIKIGKTFDREWQASLRLGLKPFAVNSQGVEVADQVVASGGAEERDRDGEKFVVWAGGISLLHLADIMNKVLEIPFTENQQRIFSRAFGKTYYAPCLIDYFHALTREDKMIDTFRNSGNPKKRLALGRHTAWDQYTNARYENKGVRIDFILIDQELGHWTKETDYYLGGGDEKFEATSEEAALRMCTAFGNYQPAGFDGNGINDVSMDVLNMQFPPGEQFVNGIVYTPPRYSDHVGVSLLLHVNASDVVKVVSDEDEKSAKIVTAPLFSQKRTRKAQPHRDTRTISSFFTSSSSSHKGGAGAHSSHGNAGSSPRQKGVVVGLKLSQSQQRTNTKKKKTTTSVSINNSSKAKRKSSNPDGRTIPKQKQKKQISLGNYFLPKNNQ